MTDRPTTDRPTTDLDDPGSPNPAYVALASRLETYLTTQLLYVAAKLDIAEGLATGPQTAQAIATRVGVDPDLLQRILRGLVLENVLIEQDGGRFALTELGTCLREGVPGSLRRAIIARAELYYGAAAGLLDTVRHGGTAFEHVHGESFFDYLARHPEKGAAFDASQADRAAQEALDVVAAYDFSTFERLIDVGGGRGIMLTAILRAAPELRAVLVDRPAVIDNARRRLQANGVIERCDCVVGDFFDSLPTGGDAYMLSRIIHDWADEDARRILAACRRAMAPGSRLLLVEMIMPDRAHDQPTVVRMDILMLTLLGARERTETQYRRLLGEAGFHVQHVYPTASPAGLHVIDATPAS